MNRPRIALLLVPLLLGIMPVRLTLAQESKPGADPSLMVVRFITGTERYTDHPARLARIQMTSEVTFISVNGRPIRDGNLPSLFQRKKGEEMAGEVIEILITFRNQEETSLQAVIQGIEKLRRAAPKNQRVRIFLMYRLKRAK